MIELRPNQIIPPGDWLFHQLTDEKRGNGKSYAGAAWLAGVINNQVEPVPIALVGPTIFHIEQIMIPYLAKPEMGLGPFHYNRARHTIQFTGGQVGHLLRPEDYMGTTGKRYAAAWADECGHQKDMPEMLNRLAAALRVAPAQAVLTGLMPYLGTRLLQRAYAR